MNRMAGPEAWAAMKACFVFMSSPPIEQKKAEALRRTSTSSVSRLLSRRMLRQLSGLGFLRRGRRGRTRGLKLEPPGLQLRWRDAELGSHTAICVAPGSDSRATACSLYSGRKPPPRLLCHPVPPGRYLIYRLVRDPGATSVLQNTDDLFFGKTRSFHSSSPFL